MFTDFLAEKVSVVGEFNLVENVHSLTDEALDELLTEFWFSARKTNGELYRVSTLDNCKYSLNRMFKKHGRSDLLKSPIFQKSQDAFKDAVRELKGLG